MTETKSISLKVTLRDAFIWAIWLTWLGLLPCGMVIAQHTIAPTLTDWHAFAPIWGPVAALAGLIAVPLAAFAAIALFVMAIALPCLGIGWIVLKVMD